MPRGVPNNGTRLTIGRVRKLSKDLFDLSKAAYRVQTGIGSHIDLTLVKAVSMVLQKDHPEISKMVAISEKRNFEYQMRSTGTSSEKKMKIAA